MCNFTGSSEIKLHIPSTCVLLHNDQGQKCIHPQHECIITSLQALFVLMLWHQKPVKSGIWLNLFSFFCYHYQTLLWCLFGQRHHQKEISALLSNDMEEWDQGLKKVLDREVRKHTQTWKIKYLVFLHPLIVKLLIVAQGKCREGTEIGRSIEASGGWIRLRKYCGK